ncbi:hypothetical protein IGI67_002722 [Enterococcus sp. AZ196]
MMNRLYSFGALDYALVKLSLLGAKELSVVNHIRKIREEKKIPQKEMARVLEVSRQTMTAIEKGKYNPSLELSLKIAAYFDMPFDEIFYLEEGKG